MLGENHGEFLLTHFTFVRLIVCSILPVQIAIAGDAAAARNAASIDRRLRSEAEGGGFQGQVLLERGGTIALHQAYGVAGPASSAPATNETLYYIGSLAKMFTSNVVLQLESEGKLSLNDKIGKHLDGVPADKSSITVAQLLSHTSGLLANHPDPLARIDRATFLTWTMATRLESKPGERFLYSNVGYSVLAALVEKIGGEPFAAAVRRRVFAPASMNDTYFLDDPGLDAQRLARGNGPRVTEYKLDGDPLRFRGTWLRMGPGGIVSTTGDLLKWEQAVREGRVLTRGQYARVTSPSAVEKGYGMGWRLSKSVRGTPLHGHDGGFPGFNAFFARFPEEQAVIIILCNRDELAATTMRWLSPEFFKP